MSSESPGGVHAARAGRRLRISRGGSFEPPARSEFKDVWNFELPPTWRERNSCLLGFFIKISKPAYELLRRLSEVQILAPPETTALQAYPVTTHKSHTHTSCFRPCRNQEIFLVHVSRNPQRFQRRNKKFLEKQKRKGKSESVLAEGIRRREVRLALVPSLLQKNVNRQRVCKATVSRKRVSNCQKRITLRTYSSPKFDSLILCCTF
jgi:hypothetical protein